MPKILIRCKVEPGMFSCESIAFIQLPNGGEASGFFSNASITLEPGYPPPATNNPVPAWLRVSESGRTEGGVYVILPQPSVTHGTQLLIRDGDTREE